MRETKGFSISGYIVGFVLAILQVVSIWHIDNQGHLNGIALLCAILVSTGWPGFFMMQPNQGRVLTLFGRYVGTEI